jgi:hypothetical protein
VATAGQHLRHEVLKPFVERLAALGQQATELTAPCQINIGSQSLQIEPWERNALLSTVGATDGEATEWEPLLAQAVALRAKTLTQLDKLTKCDESDPQQAETVYADLLSDAIIGFALSAELQRTVDRMVVDGERELAKMLTQFRAKLSRDLAALGEVIGEATLAEAEERAQSMLAAAPPTTGISKDDPNAEPPREGELNLDRPDLKKLLELEATLLRKQEEQQDPRAQDRALERLERLERLKHKTPEPEPDFDDLDVEPEHRSWALPLTCLAAVLLVVWLLVTVRPALNKVSYPAFSLEDFKQHAAIEQVASRAPSLFVTVDAHAWNGLDPADRASLVHSVGETIGAAGYTGAHFSNGSGHTLAQWMKSGGAQVFDAP